MATTTKEFNGFQITFIRTKDKDMMVNATEMAKIFDKQVTKFLSNQDTQAFVKEALKSENSHYLKVFSQSDLYYTSQQKGTFMHRVLALKFAAWLNPKFELWVYSTFERLLFGNLSEREQSLSRTLKFQREQMALKDKAVKTGEDFVRYLELERALKHETALRKSLTSDSVTEMRNLFDDNF